MCERLVAPKGVTGRSAFVPCLLEARQQRGGARLVHRIQHVTLGQPRHLLQLRARRRVSLPVEVHLGQVEMVFTLAFSRLYLREVVRREDVIGLVLVVIGVVLILVGR